MAEQDWPQEHGTAGHIAFTIRKQAEMEAGSSRALYLHHSRTTATESQAKSKVCFQGDSKCTKLKTKVKYSVWVTSKE